MYCVSFGIFDCKKRRKRKKGTRYIALEIGQNSLITLANFIVRFNIEIILTNN